MGLGMSWMQELQEREESRVISRSLFSHWMNQDGRHQGRGRAKVSTARVWDFHPLGQGEAT